jgi:hypothetical protein
MKGQMLDPSRPLIRRFSPVLHFHKIIYQGILGLWAAESKAGGQGMSENRLVLSADEQQALLDMRDHAPKAYLRERAAALLKLAAGESLTQVAQAGLLRSRDRHTLLDWLRRYQAAGLAGLRLRAGRGRKPAFFPSQPGGGAGRD